MHFTSLVHTYAYNIMRFQHTAHGSATRVRVNNDHVGRYIRSVMNVSGVLIDE